MIVAGVDYRGDGTVDVDRDAGRMSLQDVAAVYVSEERARARFFKELDEAHMIDEDTKYGLYTLLKVEHMCSACFAEIECVPCDASVNVTCQAAKIIAEVLRSGDPAFFARHFETSHHDDHTSGGQKYIKAVDLVGYPSKFGGRVLMSYSSFDYPQGGTISVSLVHKPVLD